MGKITERVDKWKDSEAGSEPTFMRIGIRAKLPKWVVDELDRLADETNTNVNEVLKEILEYVLNDEELVDDIFPEEEE